MKRAIVRNNDGTLQSMLVPLETPTALKAGDRITTTRAIDLDHAAQIKAGEQGSVVYVNAYTGAAEVLLDLLHRGLRYWDNHILLVPFDTDDILSGLTCNPAQLRNVA